MSVWRRFKRPWNRGRVALATELLREPDTNHFGYELSRNAGVSAGRMYPYLAKLLAAGHVNDGWEQHDQAVGRPPRRFYKLTPLGAEALKKFVDEHRLDNSSSK